MEDKKIKGYFSLGEGYSCRLQKSDEPGLEIIVPSGEGYITNPEIIELAKKRDKSKLLKAIKNYF